MAKFVKLIERIQINYYDRAGKEEKQGSQIQQVLVWLRH